MTWDEANDLMNKPRKVTIKGLIPIKITRKSWGNLYIYKFNNAPIYKGNVNGRLEWLSQKQYNHNDYEIYEEK